MAIGSSVTHLNASAGIFQQSINEMKENNWCIKGCKELTCEELENLKGEKVFNNDGDCEQKC